MRLILTAIILTLLAQPVWAVKTGQLLKDCKPWANNGFSLDGLTTGQRRSAMACSMFQNGVIHLGIFACLDGDPATQLFYGTSIYDPQAMTQKFINWAEANPDKWEDVANPSFWIMGTCKL